MSKLLTIYTPEGTIHHVNGSLQQPGDARNQRDLSMEHCRENSNFLVNKQLMMRDVVKVNPDRTSTVYRVGEQIGRGQFGTVYKALQLSNGHTVAIKAIDVSNKTDKEVRQLENEVHMLKHLNHPGIVKYEGLARNKHYMFIILEYIENGSLQFLMKNFGTLSEVLVANYTIKILDALIYLHSQDVVHCDLKAANILSTKSGNIKLSDFGVSLNENALESMGTGLTVNGTPNWMAPEVIQMNGTSKKSDIWSLGCTIVELWTGHPPYYAMNAFSAMYQIVESKTPPIPEDCPEYMAAFLRRCFEKDPDKRPSAHELLGDEWISRHWVGCQTLREKDSVPFFKRVGAPPRQMSLTIPLAPTRPLSPRRALADDSDVTSRASSEDSAVRPSFDTGCVTTVAGSLTKEGEMDRGLSQAREEPASTHDFILTYVFRAMDCKCCCKPMGHVVSICVRCGFAGHKRCAHIVEQSPILNVCDVRSNDKFMPLIFENYMHLDGDISTDRARKQQKKAKSGVNFRLKLKYFTRRAFQTLTDRLR